MRKLERREQDLPSDPNLLIPRAPSEPAGNHQMQHEEGVGVEPEDDALADAAHGAHRLTGNRINRRVDGSQDERAQEDDALEAMADDVALECFEVHDDVGELRQCVNPA